VERRIDVGMELGLMHTLGLMKPSQIKDFAQKNKSAVGSYLNTERDNHLKSQEVAELKADLAVLKAVGGIVKTYESLAQNASASTPKPFATRPTPFKS
jgi:acetyl-CoA carboxylase carboxyltransferase component